MVNEKNILGDKNVPPFLSELNSDVVRRFTPLQKLLKPDLLQDRFDVGGKTRNIAI